MQTIASESLVTHLAISVVILFTRAGGQAVASVPQGSLLLRKVLSGWGKELGYELSYALASVK